MDMKCCKCGRNQLFIRKSGNNTGLYCQICGAWQKWMTKDEIRAFEYQKENNRNVVKEDDNSLLLARLEDVSNKLNSLNNDVQKIISSLKTQKAGA